MKLSDLQSQNPYSILLYILYANKPFLYMYLLFLLPPTMLHLILILILFLVIQVLNYIVVTFKLLYKRHCLSICIKKHTHSIQISITSTVK